MFFKLGALLLLGSLSASSALPPCVCTRNLKPVCGSDGQTYSNECMLHCAQLSSPKLFMKRSGRCTDSNPAPSRKVRQAELNCFCTYENNPLCGTDGRTYSNRCELNCAQRSAPVEIAYQGECRDKRETVLIPIPLRNVRQAELNCFCTFENNPFCGTDGRTYSNRCELNCAQRSSQVEIAHEGECDNREKRETVQVAQLPSRCSCPRNVAPVCGSDGTTYDNSCVLDCLSQHRPELRLDHEGACGVKSCSCSREVIPVCGTDGITYDNLCNLECSKQTNQDLDVMHEGECNTVKVEDASCTCTREGRPVCGTDGNTYNNPCLLNCARATDRTLHVDYEGPCDHRVKVVDQAENFPCTCTRNLKPVCASNGVTFPNKCLMKCAGTHLTVAKEAPCED